MPLPHVVLYQPEIPPNAGNIIRLCANTGAELHLVHPLGFRLDDRRLRRAGLDYAEFARVHEHASLEAFIARAEPRRVLALSAHGERRYCDAGLGAGDALVFGPETHGLPADVVNALPPEHRLRIPMRPGSRSMNLANAVAVVVYEAWRQAGFDGGA